MAILFDGALNSCLGHPESARLPCTVALKSLPAALLEIASQRLSKEFAFGATLLSCQALGVAEESGRQRKRKNLACTHALVSNDLPRYDRGDLMRVLLSMNRSNAPHNTAVRGKRSLIVG